jgi:hypothetical protein
MTQRMQPLLGKEEKDYSDGSGSEKRAPQSSFYQSIRTKLIQDAEEPEEEYLEIVRKPKQKRKSS